MSHICKRGNCHLLPVPTCFARAQGWTFSTSSPALLKKHIGHHDKYLAETPTLRTIVGRVQREDAGFVCACGHRGTIASVCQHTCAPPPRAACNLLRRALSAPLQAGETRKRRRKAAELDHAAVPLVRSMQATTMLDWRPAQQLAMEEQTALRAGDFFSLARGAKCLRVRDGRERGGRPGQRHPLLARLGDCACQCHAAAGVCWRTRDQAPVLQSVRLQRVRPLVPRDFGSAGEAADVSAQLLLLLGFRRRSLSGHTFPA